MEQYDPSKNLKKIESNQEILDSLQRLKDEKEEVHSQIMSYEGDDKYNLEQRYDTIIKEIDATEKDIRRRAEQN